MPIVESITSTQNSKIKLVKKLRDRRGRDQEGLFVIDDKRDLHRALTCAYAVEYAFYCPELSPEHNADAPLLAQIQTIYQVPKALMHKVSYRENPSSLLAVMRQPPPPGPALLDDIAQTQTHILTLVDLRKPGNIGALLRTADAMGVQAVFLVDTALDIYNPNIIRSSTGACFLGNIFTLGSAQALDFFKRSGYALIAALVDGEKSVFEADFSRRAAIVLGTEDQGLSPQWVQAADQRVRIPMMGRLSDSLNVSVSGALFMAEALRQSL